MTVTKRKKVGVKGGRLLTCESLVTLNVFCFYSIRNVSDSRTRLLTSNGFVVD